MPLLLASYRYRYRFLLLSPSTRNLIISDHAISISDYNVCSYLTSVIILLLLKVMADDLTRKGMMPLVPLTSYHVLLSMFLILYFHVSTTFFLCILLCPCNFLLHPIPFLSSLVLYPILYRNFSVSLPSPCIILRLFPNLASSCTFSSCSPIPSCIYLFPSLCLQCMSLFSCVSTNSISSSGLYSPTSLLLYFYCLFPLSLQMHLIYSLPNTPHNGSLSLSFPSPQNPPFSGNLFLLIP